MASSIAFPGHSNKRPPPSATSSPSLARTRSCLEAPFSGAASSIARSHARRWRSTTGSASLATSPTTSIPSSACWNASSPNTGSRQEARSLSSAPGSEPAAGHARPSSMTARLEPKPSQDVASVRLVLAPYTPPPAGPHQLGREPPLQLALRRSDCCRRILTTPGRLLSVRLAIPLLEIDRARLVHELPRVVVHPVAWERTRRCELVLVRPVRVDRKREGRPSRRRMNAEERLAPHPPRCRKPGAAADGLQEPNASIPHFRLRPQDLERNARNDDARLPNAAQRGCLGSTSAERGFTTRRASRSLAEVLSPRRPRRRYVQLPLGGPWPRHRVRGREVGRRGCCAARPVDGGRQSGRKARAPSAFARWPRPPLPPHDRARRGCSARRSARRGRRARQPSAS